MTPEPTDLSSLRIDRSAPSRGGGGGRAWAIVVLVMLAVALVLGWMRFAPHATPVQVATVETTGGPSATGGGITANGYVVARTKASVSAKIPGRLASLGVSEGSRVRKGEIMARIENRDYVAALTAARAGTGTVEAQLAQARRDLTRAERLRQQQVVSDLEVEKARTQVDVLVAQLASAAAQAEVAAANLENTNVRAPFDGTVLRKDAEVGEIVAPSSAGGGLTRTAIVTMADLGTLEVEVDVNEAYIAQVKNGQPARITLDAYPDTSFSARVRQVVPTADRQKATVLVKVAILDKDPRILPEMGARVEFVRDAALAAAAPPRRMYVPGAALASGGTRVWVVENGVARARMVTTAPEKDGRVEVLQGLDGGESVVLAAPATLADGAKVKVSQR